MITDTLSAWVIHKYWSGETSVRVVFFTKEYGLLPCLYKGGRTPKKQALLQAFTPLWLTANVYQNYYYVRQLELATPMPMFSGGTLLAGLYLNELIHYALKREDPHPTLYVAYQHALETLSTVSEQCAIEVVLRRFEWALLCACGYPWSWREEAHSAAPIMSDRYYRFVAGEGFLQAEDGLLGAHVLAIAAEDWGAPRVLASAKRIMRLAIAHLLDGRILKTRELYRGLDKPQYIGVDIT